MALARPLPAAVCPHCSHVLSLEDVDRLVDNTLAELIDVALDGRDRKEKALN